MKSQADYRMVPYSMTLCDPGPGFEGRSIFVIEFVKKRCQTVISYY